MMKFTKKQIIIGVAVVAIISMIPVLVVLSVVLFARNAYVNTSSSKDDTEVKTVETEEKIESDIALQTYSRKENISEWSIPANVTIDEKLSEEEVESIRKTLFQVEFPVERIGDFSIMLSGNYFINHEDPPRAIALKDTSTILINEDSIDEDTYNSTLAHELGHIITFKLEKHHFYDVVEFRKIRGIKKPVSESWSERDIEDFAEVFVKYYYDEDYLLSTVYEQDVFEDNKLKRFYNETYNFINDWPKDQASVSKYFVTSGSKDKLNEKFGTVILPTSISENWNITGPRYWTLFSSSLSDEYENPVFQKDFDNCSTMMLFPVINSQRSIPIQDEYVQYIEFQHIELDICNKALDNFDYSDYSEFKSSIDSIFEEKREETQKRESLVTIDKGFTIVAINNTSGVSHQAIEDTFGKSTDQVFEINGEELTFSSEGNFYHLRAYGYFSVGDFTEFLKSFERVQ